MDDGAVVSEQTLAFSPFGPGELICEIEGGKWFDYLASWIFFGPAPIIILLLLDGGLRIFAILELCGRALPPNPPPEGGRIAAFKPEE